MQTQQVIDAAQDDLLEVLAENVTQLMTGNDRLDARTSTERNRRAPRGAGLRAQIGRQI